MSTTTAVGGRASSRSQTALASGGGMSGSRSSRSRPRSTQVHVTTGCQSSSAVHAGCRTRQIQRSGPRSRTLTRASTRSRFTRRPPYTRPNLKDREEIMTTLKDRPNTALLVIDVQTGVVRGAHERDEVIAHTNLYWKYQTAPGRTAGTVETKDVDFGRNAT